MQDSVLLLCCVISGSHLTSLGLTSIISPQCPPHGSVTRLGLHYHLSLPQYWNPNSPRSGHIFFISGVLHHACAHLGIHPLYSVKFGSLCLERKMEDKAKEWYLELLQVPAVTFSP